MKLIYWPNYSKPYCVYGYSPTEEEGLYFRETSNHIQKYLYLSNENTLCMLKISNDSLEYDDMMKVFVDCAQEYTLCSLVQKP